VSSPPPHAVRARLRTTRPARTVLRCFMRGCSPSGGGAGACRGGGRGRGGAGPYGGEPGGRRGELLEQPVEHRRDPAVGGSPARVGHGQAGGGRGPGQRAAERPQRAGGGAAGRGVLVGNGGDRRARDVGEHLGEHGGAGAAPQAVSSGAPSATWSASARSACATPS
jgi:hypothetical protein